MRLSECWDTEIFSLVAADEDYAHSLFSTSIIQLLRVRST